MCEKVSAIRKKASVPWLAVTALMAAPLGDVSAASLYVNDGDSGQCSQMLGAGLLGVQIPISIVANKACGVTSLADLSSAGASKGTLSLNTNGAFLLGDMHIAGALDLNGNALHNLADGAAVTDAVNLRQLRANAQSVANALGGFTITNANGSITQPLYVVQGVATDNVGSALRLLDGGITTNTANLASLTTRVSGDEGSILGLLEGRLGIVRQAGAGTITVGAESAGALLNVAGGDGDRRITGIADGVGGNDAATMNQLQHVKDQMADVSALSVQYDDADKHALTLGGLTAGTTVTLHNVADAELSSDSKDAVNGSQLFATNNQVSQNTDNINTLGSRITVNENNIDGLLGGTLGLVQQADMSSPITVAAGSGGRVITVTGTDGDRVISGVADGTQANDAVNVRQLKALGDRMDSSTALAVSYDDADKTAITLGGVGAAVPVSLHNIADAELSEGSHDAVNGAQLFATNNQVSQNTDDINTLGNRVTVNENNIDGLLGGTLGLVQQAGMSSAVTVAAGSGGHVITVTGTDGDRTITGVADGAESNDAVNVRQLKALQDLVGSSSAMAVSYDDIGRSAITLGGAGATTPVALHNVADGQAAFDAVNVGQLTNLQHALQSQIGDMSSQVNLLGNRVGVLEQSATGSGAGSSIDLPYLDGQAGGQGNAATAGDTPGVALGYDSVATGYNASAIGQSAQALGDHGTAIGANAFAAGPGDTALGGNAMVHADNSVAVGSGATVAGNATDWARGHGGFVGIQCCCHWRGLSSHASKHRIGGIGG
jgi:trimeric autotransporter adhesin